MTTDPVFDHLFLGIGAMKAGTTWLYDVLNRHPEIHFSREKEIHYFFAKYVRPGILSERARLRRAKGYLAFDPEKAAARVFRRRVSWVAQWLAEPVDDAWFRGLFRGVPPGRWVCDFSNLAALVPEEGWREIHANTRKLRVLYTLREPLDRTWSHVRFHLKMQGKAHLLDSWSPDELYHHVRTGDYLDHSDYVSVIRRLQATLPPETFKIAFYDHISEQPAQLIEDIEGFLDLEHRKVPEGLLKQVVNPSPPRPMPPRLKERLLPFVTVQVAGLKDLGITPPASWG